MKNYILDTNVLLHDPQSIYKFSDNIVKLPPELRNDRGDNRILAIAQDLQENLPQGTVFLVSKDINLRIKADTIGLSAEDYQSDKFPIEDLYTGTSELLLPKDQIDNPYVDSASNGLSFSVERLKGQDITGHTTLSKGERSLLAELAANLL